AASAGQAELVLKAIDELDAEFEIDAFGMKAESLAEAAKHLKDAEDRQAFVEATLKTVDDAVDADDFEHALKLGAIAQSASVKARDPELKKRVASRVTELKKLQKDWESLAEARQKLEASPDDAGANAQVGRYVCLQRGDWEHGLPMLAKGDDKKLAPLAERELADPVETDEQIKLADDWWNATLGESAAVKDRLQSHAAEWYSRALPQLTGVSKLRVEKRVASLEGKDRPKKSKKQAAQQPPALVGNPLMPVNPVMPAAPNNRPTDYDFERKFAQRLIDQRANTLNLRGERGTAGGPMRTLPDWPFYVEGFMALGDSNVSDDDLADVQRLHGLSSIWIDTGKVTDRSVSRLARNGTLRSVRLGMNAQVTLNALQGCTELETLELAGNLDLSAIGALAAKMPRLNSLTLITAASAPVNLAFLPKLPALQSLRLDKATLTDEMLDSIQRCPRLTRLSLISATFAVKDFRPKVASANSLSLELMAASVSAAEFKIFATVFPRMESLHLNGAKVDAAVWRELQSLSQLRVLQIPQTSITDNDLQYLPGTLRDLNVSYCAITGEGFRKRRAVFPELTGLALNSSELTDEGLQAALELTPALQRLFVGKTKISPAVFEQVAKLPFLNFVSMTDLEDSDACLEPLSKARSLRNIYGKFSPEAVAKFRQIRPDCNVR
ncbi:MAG TPA: hypothetical protein VHB77_17250, partial [Planctomycetaceae bacterium]|nr:hypothetical protein [Planctomycetaceae bacterium]